MTLYEEDSGRILISLVRAGATIDMNEDIFSLMQHMACLLYDVRHVRREAKTLSHYAAAVLILDHLGDLFSLRCENASREKILAVLSTELRNFRSLHRSKRRSRSVRRQELLAGGVSVTESAGLRGKAARAGSANARRSHANRCR